MSTKHSGVSEYVQVIFDKWYMQIQLDTVVHAYILGFDFKTLTYDSIDEPEDYMYWNKMLKSCNNKNVHTWFNGYDFNKVDKTCKENKGNGLPKIFSLPVSEFVYSLLEHYSKQKSDLVDSNGESSPCDFNKTTSVSLDSPAKNCAGIRLVYFLYAKILAENCHKISKMILNRDRKDVSHSIKAPSTGLDIEDLFLFDKPGVIEIADGLSVVSSEEIGSVTFSFQNLDAEICRLMESVAENLGIVSSYDNHLHIPACKSVKFMMKDILIDDSAEEDLVDKALGALRNNLANIRTFLILLWEQFLNFQRTLPAFDLYGKDYWYKRGLLFKELLSQADSDKALSLLKPLNLTDEHHFFIADTFPYVIDSPGSLQIDPSSKYVENDYSGHIIILVHGYGGNPITVRGFRNNILTIFRGTKCIVPLCIKNDYNQPIEILAERLSQEIEDNLRSQDSSSIKKISFVTHSLGGILVRSALKYMAPYLDKLHAFITISTPHIGYPVGHRQELFPTCMSLYASIKKAKCLNEMLMKGTSHSKEYRDSLLYKLSHYKCISNFKKIVLIGVKNDKKAYAYSALINASELKPNEVVACEMEANILENVDLNNLKRIKVSYKYAKKYLHEANKHLRKIAGRGYYAHSNIMDERIVNRILLGILYDTF
ncbi:serine esterase family member protein [Theileria equi strain WA]|uniref:Serine esterase family member protein n=1 Tax=Theileria equi strain WA TaxID=1537102 RepID=L0B309_THEEQ|nr:serine esterase family member protein [Theileria equi strain WA]AFZ81489.1 serine esterase family member protein [Theileria equi strain WA]|eukprot:XP_004831155.1 serine esterase family member protein [Theileria equi strain WA]